jgi:hypothetical protein
VFESVFPMIQHVESGLVHDPSPSPHHSNWIAAHSSIVPFDYSPRSRSRSDEHDELVFVYGGDGVGHKRM